MPLGGQEAVARVAEKALERLHAQVQLRAFIDVARAVHAHVAARLGQVIGHGVFQAVGTDHGIATAQLGVAFDHGVHVGLALDAVAAHEHGQLVAHLGGDLLLQQGAGAQWARGRFLLGPGGGRQRPGQQRHSQRAVRQTGAAMQLGGGLAGRHVGGRGKHVDKGDRPEEQGGRGGL